MRHLRMRIATVAACIIATLGLVTTVATPAYAGENLRTHMYGSAHPFYDLGSGFLFPGPGGTVAAEDTFCDGSNGIVASVYYLHYNEWKRTDVVSARGCGAFRWDYISAPPESYLRFRVCKHLPDGTWKDCFDKYTTND